MQHSSPCCPHIAREQVAMEHDNQWNKITILILFTTLEAGSRLTHSLFLSATTLYDMAFMYLNRVAKPAWNKKAEGMELEHCFSKLFFFCPTFYLSLIQQQEQGGRASASIDVR